MSRTKTDLYGMEGMIVGELRAISSECSQKVRKIAEEEGQQAVRMLEQLSPKRTGKYSKSWRSKLEQSGSFRSPRIKVYSELWQLTHLLENGHCLRDGTGRKYGEVSAKPHIQEVQKIATERFIRRLEDEL